MTDYLGAVLAAARQELPMSVGIDSTWLNPDFKLSGPRPMSRFRDVHDFLTACADNALIATLDPGLALKIQGRGRLFFVTFYLTNDGSHRFYEMSSDHEHLWTGSHPMHGPDETQAALRYLRTLEW